MPVEESIWQGRGRSFRGRRLGEGLFWLRKVRHGRCPDQSMMMKTFCKNTTFFRTNRSPSVVIDSEEDRTNGRYPFIIMYSSFFFFLIPDVHFQLII